MSFFQILQSNVYNQVNCSSYTAWRCLHKTAFLTNTYNKPIQLSSTWTITVVAGRWTFFPVQRRSKCLSRWCISRHRYAIKRTTQQPSAAQFPALMQGKEMVLLRSLSALAISGSNVDAGLLRWLWPQCRANIRCRASLCLISWCRVKIYALVEKPHGWLASSDPGRSQFEGSLENIYAVMSWSRLHGK